MCTIQEGLILDIGQLWQEVDVVAFEYVETFLTITIDQLFFVIVAAFLEPLGYCLDIEMFEHIHFIHKQAKTLERRRGAQHSTRGLL